MKRRIIPIVLILAVALITSLAVYVYFIEKGMEIVRTEYYRNGDDCLKIGYERNGKSISFDFSNDVKRCYFGCGADLVSENTFVFDGSEALPESDEYLTFTFGEGCVKVEEEGTQNYPDIYYLIENKDE